MTLPENKEASESVRAISVSVGKIEESIEKYDLLEKIEENTSILPELAEAIKKILFDSGTKENRASWRNQSDPPVNSSGGEKEGREVGRDNEPNLIPKPPTPTPTPDNRPTANQRRDSAPTLPEQTEEEKAGDTPNAPSQLYEGGSQVPDGGQQRDLPSENSPRSDSSDALQDQRENRRTSKIIDGIKSIAKNTISSPLSGGDAKDATGAAIGGAYYSAAKEAYDLVGSAKATFSNEGGDTGALTRDENGRFIRAGGGAAGGGVAGGGAAGGGAAGGGVAGGGAAGGGAAGGGAAGGGAAGGGAAGGGVAGGGVEQEIKTASADVRKSTTPSTPNDQIARIGGDESNIEKSHHGKENENPTEKLNARRKRRNKKANTSRPKSNQVNNTGTPQTAKQKIIERIKTASLRLIAKSNIDIKQGQEGAESENEKRHKEIIDELKAIAKAADSSPSLLDKLGGMFGGRKGANRTRGGRRSRQRSSLNGNSSGDDAQRRERVRGQSGRPSASGAPAPSPPPKPSLASRAKDFAKGGVAKLAIPITLMMAAWAKYSSVKDDPSLNDSQKTAQVASNVVGTGAGMLAGAAAGAATGALIGSVVPLFGTFIGGLLGLVGGAIGAYFGGSIGDWFGSKLSSLLGDDNKKGFFGGLKSMILGDDKSETKAENKKTKSRATVKKEAEMQAQKAKKEKEDNEKAVRVKKYRSSLEKTAKEVGVPVEDLEKIMIKGSGGDNNTYNSKTGGHGLMQVPALEFGKYNVSDPTSEDQNIMAGAVRYKEFLDSSKGDSSLAIENYLKRPETLKTLAKNNQKTRTRGDIKRRQDSAGKRVDEIKHSSKIRAIKEPKVKKDQSSQVTPDQIEKAMIKGLLAAEKMKPKQNDKVSLTPAPQMKERHTDTYSQMKADDNI